jgi:hypothetical protein
MRWRAQRREVLPNICASLRSDDGLPVSILVRYAATAAALISVLAFPRRCERPAFPWSSLRSSGSRSGPYSSLHCDPVSRAQPARHVAHDIALAPIRAMRSPDQLRRIGEPSGAGPDTSRSVTAWWSGAPWLGPPEV